VGDNVLEEQTASIVKAEDVPPKCWYSRTSPHCVTIQKITMDAFTAARTSNFIFLNGLFQCFPRKIVYAFLSDSIFYEIKEKINGVTTQKSTINIFTAVKTPNRKMKMSLR
jgi:hypothetical protein